MSDDQTKKMQDLKSRLGLVAKGEAAPTDSTAPIPETPANDGFEGSEADFTEDDFVDEEVEVTGQADMDASVSGKRGPLIGMILFLVVAFFAVGYFLGGKSEHGEIANQTQSAGADLKVDLESLDIAAIDTHRGYVNEVTKSIVGEDFEAALIDVVNTGSGVGELAGQLDVLTKEEMLLEAMDTCAAYEQSFEPKKTLGAGFHATDLLAPLVRFYHRVNLVQSKSRALAEMKSAVLASRAQLDKRLAENFYGIGSFLVAGEYGGQGDGEVFLLEGEPTIVEVDRLRRRSGEPKTMSAIRIGEGEEAPTFSLSRVVRNTKALNEVQVATYLALDKAAHEAVLRQAAAALIELYVAVYGVNTKDFIARVEAAAALPRF